MHKSIIKSSAISMRKQGFSLSEISAQLSISQTTASVWLRNINLDEVAKQKIMSKQMKGREKVQILLHEKKNTALKNLLEAVENDIKKVELNPVLCKLLCAFLYWGEGSKSGSSLSFINSDPVMVKTFLTLLRKGFKIEESKFKALIHIHAYHDENEMLEYWSKITNIPIQQFNKSYKKPNTGKFIKEGYKGCVRIRYYDVQIARELMAIYNTTAKTLIGV